jgi:hypothetical protein
MNENHKENKDEEDDAPRVQGVTYMRLCETKFLIMRPDRLYYFTVDRNCDNCMALAKIYENYE